LVDGTRDLLDLWIEGTEGAKFWMKVSITLKKRCVGDILIANTDDVRSIGGALGAVFSSTTLTTCTVHPIRNSLDCAGWKDHELLAAALRPVYTSASAEAAALALDEFEHGTSG
jgi:transposase-like protein